MEVLVLFTSARYVVVRLNIGSGRYFSILADSVLVWYASCNNRLTQNLGCEKASAIRAVMLCVGTTHSVLLAV